MPSLDDLQVALTRLRSELAAATHITRISPTVGSCGTAPTIAGTDLQGRVALDTGVTVCTITFGTAFTATPVCVGILQGAATTTVLSINTILTSSVAFNLSASTGFPAFIHYMCHGDVASGV
jgi:hypothetical protein